MIFPPGATSQSITVTIVDDDGLPVTGLVASTMPTINYRKSRAAESSISLTDLAALTSSYSSGGVKEASAGRYRLDLPDAAVSTADNVAIYGEATGKRLIVDPAEQVAYMQSDLRLVLGTAPTESAGGRLAGGITKFFNVATPTGTLNSLPDAVAGAAGGLLIAGSNAATTFATMTITSGYLPSKLYAIDNTDAAGDGAAGGLYDAGRYFINNNGFIALDSSENPIALPTNFETLVIGSGQSIGTSTFAAGDEVTLTVDQLTALVAAVEAEIANDATGAAIKQQIVDKILENLPDIDDLSLSAIANAARDAILDRILSGNHDIAGTVGKVLQDTATQASAAATSAASADTNTSTILTNVSTVNDTVNTINTATAATQTLAAGANGFANIKIDTAASKAKTDYLPSATAGAAGGVLIAGSNAATTFATLTSTGAFTINGTSQVAQSGDGYAVLTNGTYGLAAMKALLDAIPTAGVGSFTRTVTVTDEDDAPIVGASVSMSGNRALTTDINGQAVFYSNAGTFTISAAANGYIGDSVTVVITASGSTTIQLDSLGITPPAAPGNIVGYTVTRNADGTAKAGVTLKYYIDDPTPTGSGDGSAWWRRTQSAVSDTDGLVQIQMVKGAKYQVQWPDGKNVAITAPTTGSSFELSEIVSNTGG